MNVSEAIRNKRAVRTFQPDPVPKDLIVKIVNAGRLAQSSKNMQAWHFIIVTRKDTLTALAACGQFAGHIAGAAFAVVILTPDPDLRFNVMFDAGQAAAYMQLLALENGVGSCLATIYEREQARKLLGFPEELHVRIAISFGFPADQTRKPARQSGRRDRNEVVSWEKWDNEAGVHNPLRTVSS